MTKNSNGIIKSMVIIAEKFNVLNITEDDLIEAADAQTFLHLFENVKDFSVTYLDIGDGLIILK